MSDEEIRGMTQLVICVAVPFHVSISHYVLSRIISVHHISHITLD